jgi:hypothetical protein
MAGMPTGGHNDRVYRGVARRFGPHTQQMTVGSVVIE